MNATLQRIRMLPLAGAVTAMALSMLAGCTSSQAEDQGSSAAVINPQYSPLNGTVIRDMRPPDITLTDTGGSPYNLRDDSTAPLTLVFLGYTNCPDECPTLAADITLALRELAPEARDKVQVVFITADPERDTPKAIRNWLDRFDRRYEGLTGSKGRIEQFAAQLGIAINGRTKTTIGPPGGYDIGHGLQVFAFDSTDNSAVLWNGSPSVRKLAADLALLTASSP